MNDDDSLRSEARQKARADEKALTHRRALMTAAVDAAQPGLTWWPALAPLTKAERRFVLGQLGVKS